jgi:hypothetical protein
MDWINFTLQVLDAGDIPLYQDFCIALAHVLPEQTDEYATRGAFYTSFDEGRPVSEYSQHDPQYQSDLSRSDEREVEKFYTARQNPRPSDRLSRAFQLDSPGNLFTRSTAVEIFLEDLSDRELLGYNLPFDSFD